MELPYENVNSREQIPNILGKHAYLCSGDLGNITRTSHRIELILGSRSLRQMPHLQVLQGLKVEKEVEQIIEAGVIQPLQSEWTLPVVVVPKPNRSLRFFVDYRRLKALSYKDCYPMPRMDECIDSLGEGTFVLGPILCILRC